MGADTLGVALAGLDLVQGIVEPVLGVVRWLVLLRHNMSNKGRAISG